jgi:hypothetical protein
MGHVTTSRNRQLYVLIPTIAMPSKLAVNSFCAAYAMTSPVYENAPLADIAIERGKWRLRVASTPAASAVVLGAQLAPEAATNDDLSICLSRIVRHRDLSCPLL